MVKFKSIIKVINNYLTKCTYTLKLIRESIQKSIKNLTDNEYEYDTLMEMIPKFFRDWYNHTEGEKLIVIDFEGNVYENYSEKREVGIPYDAKIKGEDEGLLIDLHNHKSGCPFPSWRDYNSMIKYNQKYKLSIGKKGFVISKCTEGFSEQKLMLSKDVVQSYGHYDSNLRTKLKKEGIININDSFELQEQELYKYLTDNTEQETINLTKQFKEDNIPIICQYIEMNKK